MLQWVGYNSCLTFWAAERWNGCSMKWSLATEEGGRERGEGGERVKRQLPHMQVAGL